MRIKHFHIIFERMLTCGAFRCACSCCDAYSVAVGRAFVNSVHLEACFVVAAVGAFLDFAAEAFNPDFIAEASIVAVVEELQCWVSFGVGPPQSLCAAGSS